MPADCPGHLDDDPPQKSLSGAEKRVKAAWDNVKLRKTLQVAVQNGDTATVTEFLGTYPDAANWTSMKIPMLDYAATAGQAEVVRLLLRHGANPAVAEAQGYLGRDTLVAKPTLRKKEP